jgi:hypothetical protein
MPFGTTNHPLWNEEWQKYGEDIIKVLFIHQLMHSELS